MRKNLVSVVLLALLVFPLISAVGTVAASSDDWTMFRHDPTHTGASSTAPATSSSLLWNFTTGAPMGASAAILDGKVYVPSNDGTVYCLNAADGTQVWAYPIPTKVQQSAHPSPSQTATPTSEAMTPTYTV